MFLQHKTGAPKHIHPHQIPARKHRREISKEHRNEINNPTRSYDDVRAGDSILAGAVHEFVFLAKLGGLALQDTVHFMISMAKWGVLLMIFICISYIWEGLVLFFFYSLDIFNDVMHMLDSTISAIAGLVCTVENAGSSIIGSVSGFFGGSSPPSVSCNTYNNLIINAMGGTYQYLLRLQSRCDALDTWQDVLLAVFDGSALAQLNDIARFLYPARDLYNVYVGVMSPLMSSVYPNTTTMGCESCKVCGWLKFYLVIREFMPRAIFILVLIASYKPCIMWFLRGFFHVLQKIFSVLRKLFKSFRNQHAQQLQQQQQQ